MKLHVMSITTVRGNPMLLQATERLVVSLRRLMFEAVLLPAGSIWLLVTLAMLIKCAFI